MIDNRQKNMQIGRRKEKEKNKQVLFSILRQGHQLRNLNVVDNLQKPGNAKRKDISRRAVCLLPRSILPALSTSDFEKQWFTNGPSVLCGRGDSHLASVVKIPSPSALNTVAAAAVKTGHDREVETPLWSMYVNEGCSVYRLPVKLDTRTREEGGRAQKRKGNLSEQLGEK